MQIIIDIPVITLLNINSRELLLCSREDIEKLEFAIKNGTPLDKIRAEIESQREDISKKNCEHPEDEGLRNYYFGLNDGLKDARDIIDKYRTEREG